MTITVQIKGLSDSTIQWTVTQESAAAVILQTLLQSSGPGREVDE